MNRMRASIGDVHLLASLVFLIALVAVVGAADSHADQAETSQTPASQPGGSDEALRLLAEHVAAMVASEQLVGCEVHVISGGKTVLHETYGWADRDAGRKLEPNAIYCVRSMTKPVIGTVAQMLIDEGRLSLDDRVAKYLPAFDRERLRDVTVEHLLTHTSGLPLTALNRRPLKEFATLADVANDAAATGLDFEPGTQIQYSDSGSDTLGAVIEAATGERLETLVTEHVLKPLGMNDTLTRLAKDDPRVKRVPSAYSGGTGAWMRHWSCDDEPFFPLFLASQSLYCTTADYAKFLTLWMKDGVVDGQRLLSEAAVRRALAPGRPFAYPVGFQNTRLSYGQLWMLLHDASGSSERPVALGHGGSDGTLAWAWPQRALIVLVFTQSREALGLLTIEPVIDQLLIRGDLDGYRAGREKLQARAGKTAAYEGLYWDDATGRSYFALRADGDRLIAESPGRYRFVLTRKDSERFRIEGDETEVSFESSGTGVPSAIIVHEPEGDQRKPRFVSDPTLPSGAEITRRVKRAHGIEKLGEVGLIRLAGSFSMPDRGLEGTVVRVFDRTRSRMELSMAESTTTVITTETRGVVQRGDQPRQELDGIMLKQALLSHPAAIFGDWERFYVDIEVLRRLKEDGVERLLVRTTPEGGSGASRIVDVATGRVVGEGRIEQIAGVGLMGMTIEYSDFREIGGVTLPFRTETRFAHPLLPRMVQQYEMSEAGVSDDGVFELGEE